MTLSSKLLIHCAYCTTTKVITPAALTGRTLFSCRSELIKLLAVASPRDATAGQPLNSLSVTKAPPSCSGTDCCKYCSCLRRSLSLSFPLGFASSVYFCVRTACVAESKRRSYYVIECYATFVALWDHSNTHLCQLHNQVASAMRHTTYIR
jgi:hypothetical protein